MPQCCQPCCPPQCYFVPVYCPQPCQGSCGWGNNAYCQGPACYQQWQYNNCNNNCGKEHHRKHFLCRKGERESWFKKFCKRRLACDTDCNDNCCPNDGCESRDKLRRWWGHSNDRSNCCQQYICCPPCCCDDPCAPHGDGKHDAKKAEPLGTPDKKPAGDGGAASPDLD
jgi:hypothetical protein